jgi:hypothetical protein
MALSANATQEFVPIKEIRDGIIILKDGTMRAILAVSSVNLALKSADEQRAVIMQFQNFLNSLDFPVQICVQSRRYDVRPYLLMLEDRKKEQLEPLLKIQTAEYIDFIKYITDKVNIMTKNFFVVVPYNGDVEITTSSSFLNTILGTKKATSKKTSEEVSFDEHRNQLDQRIGVVAQGLQNCGIRVSQLTEDMVVELFYKTMNPGDTSQGIAISQITTK